MAGKFDGLLVKAGQTDSGRMKTLRVEHSMAEFLKSRADMAETVRKIVSDVAARGDAAQARERLVADLEARAARLREDG